MRPTGKLHLGNYMGALKNWVDLQDEYECYFFIADWHALTSDYADPSQIVPNTIDVMLDYLAAGLDPARSVLFQQSKVLQHAELHLLLSMITPLGWLERVPTYKEQQENLSGKDLSTYGFLGYPLLQAADILIYQPQFVPVGPGPAGARRTHAGGGAAFQPVLQAGRARGAARAAGEADALAQAPRHRRAQDVEELRQHHPDDRSGAGGAQEAEAHGHRPGARAAHRSRRPRQVPRRRPAQGVLERGNAGQGLRGMPHRRHRLHRMQELGCRRPGADPQSHPGAAGEVQRSRRGGDS